MHYDTAISPKYDVNGGKWFLLNRAGGTSTVAVLLLGEFFHVQYFVVGWLLHCWIRKTKELNIAGKSQCERPFRWGLSC